VCHMSRPPHPPWLYLANDVRGSVQIMKLLIVQLPLFSCYFFPLLYKHSSQTTVLKHPQFMLFPLCERPSFTPTQNKWQNYGSVYFNLYIPRQQAGRQKTVNRMVASIPRILPALNLFVHVILIC
jgi:hypothetical protein